MTEDDTMIPILGLDSADQLDRQFRPGGGFIARGPFRVYSPDWDHWTFGYDLEQVGPHLIFQDGTGVGRPIPVDDYSRTAACEGSMIWLQGYDGDLLSTFLLTPATLEDFTTCTKKKIRFSSWEDGAKVVRQMLEADRWESFGISWEAPLVTPHGLVCWVEKSLPVVGLYSVNGTSLLRRVEGEWVAVDSRTQPWRSEGAPEAVWFPLLDSGVERFDHLADYDGLTINTAQMGTYVFPHVMLKRPLTWVSQVRQRLLTTA